MRQFDSSELNHQGWIFPVDTVIVQVKPGSEQWFSDEVAVQEERHKLLDALAHDQKILVLS